METIDRRTVFAAGLAAASLISSTSASAQQVSGGSAEARLRELNIELPKAMAPVANYVPAVRLGNVIFLAGAPPIKPDGKFATGKVGIDVTLDARAATRLTEEADRIAAAAISFDVEDDTRVESPTIAADSALAATLSDRERQVFERLVLGASNAEIADELVITVETVKTHVKRILRKIGAINRSEAIALYMDDARTAFRRRTR